MNWTVPPIWEGGDVWILGGGSSVPKQFGIPDKVVEDVVKGISPPSVYSPYMEAIHNCHVIGINVSYLIGTWIDMCFFGDIIFLQKNREKLSQWPRLKVTCHSGAGTVSWIKYLAKDPAKPTGITSNPRMVSWNANSGSAAISVAANMGAKRIMLLGFDMNFGTDGKKHWHDLYKTNPEPEPVRKRRQRERGGIPASPFGKHLLGFPDIAEDAKKRGIEIINVNPDSAITVFPKYNLKELLLDNS